MASGKNTIADPALLLASSDPQSTTVAKLPTTGNTVGDRHTVIDANSATFNATAAAGGSNVVPVFWNGTAWKIG